MGPSMSNPADDSGQWKALRVPVLQPDGAPGKECRLPTPADIERVEADLGFKATASYRGFTQVFGPGPVGREGVDSMLLRLRPGEALREYDLRRRVLKFRESWEKASWLPGP